MDRRPSLFLIHSNVNNLIDPGARVTKKSLSRVILLVGLFADLIVCLFVFYSFSIQARI